MKCIHCGSDSNYKTRKGNGGRCGACRHPFAFEPRENRLSMTDRRFERVIRNVSGDGSVAFTERQLWYELNRNLWRGRFWRAPWGGVAAASGLGGIVSTIAFGAIWPLAAGAAGIALGAIMSRRGPRRAPGEPRLDYGRFLSECLGPWTRAHVEILRMLPPPAPRPELVKRETEPDLTAYSFDRALVTDGAETAAMLVANNFHFENNCAILSADGYPYDLRETVMGMLRRNPELKVFAVHDATAAGCALPQTLREERWFPDHAIRIVDLGLRPHHVQRLNLFTPPGTARVLPSEQRANLAPEEVAWLEQGHTAEAAALRPARLMRAIYQGFARAGQVGAADSGGDGGIIWFYDGGADVYAADSFG
jgi:hypothetical protein